MASPAAPVRRLRRAERLAAALRPPTRVPVRYAGWEPEFRDLTDSLTVASTDIAGRNLATLISDGPWLGWASRLIPALTIEPSSHGWTLGG